MLKVPERKQGEEWLVPHGFQLPVLLLGECVDAGSAYAGGGNVTPAESFPITLTGPYFDALQSTLIPFHESYSFFSVQGNRAAESKNASSKAVIECLRIAEGLIRFIFQHPQLFS